MSSAFASTTLCATLGFAAGRPSDHPRHHVYLLMPLGLGALRFLIYLVLTSAVASHSVHGVFANYFGGAYRPGISSGSIYIHTPILISARVAYTYCCNSAGMGFFYLPNNCAMYILCANSHAYRVLPECRPRSTSLLCMMIQTQLSVVRIDPRTSHPESDGHTDHERWQFYGIAALSPPGWKWTIDTSGPADLLLQISLNSYWYCCMICARRTFLNALRALDIFVGLALLKVCSVMITIDSDSAQIYLWVLALLQVCSIMITINSDSAQP